MKKTICLLLTVLMLAALSCPAFAANDNAGVNPGDTMPDFTVSLTDGTTATLSELLKEKDLVVLNFFTTWCKPCEVEFPDMDACYQANRDRMVILSVSNDPDDTMEMVADYKAGHGLSFPMGLAGEALSLLNVHSFPTTYFIDHDGKISFLKIGSFGAGSAFEEKVSTVLSSDFDGTALPTEKAFPFGRVLLLTLAALFVLLILLVIGRWCLFSKAGKPGWHSLIPFLSNYEEFSLCWKGWIGILNLLCIIGAYLVFRSSTHNNLTFIFMAVLLLAAFITSLLESLKLAKAFGKGTGVGVMLLLFHQLSRFCLGVSRATFAGKETPAPIVE